MADLLRAGFIYRTRKGLRCSACGKDGMSETDLALHEDEPAHVLAIRELDGMQPRSSPPRYSPARDAHVLDPAMSSPPPQPRASDAYAAMDPDTAPLLPHPAHAIHGPALPGDDPLQLYDNWANDLGTQFQTQRDTEVGPPGSGHDGGISSPHSAHSGPTFDAEFAAYAPEDPVQEERDESRLFEPNPLQVDEEDNASWFPWANRQEALFDIMRSFPRSMFSQKELSSVKWLMEKFGLTELPGVDKLRDVQSEITDLAGADTTTIDGPLGNVFSHNSIETIIRHEWANPSVRPQIQTYPEESDKHREHACQGDKWSKEINASLAAPMARYKGHDFFVDEVAVADIAQVADGCPVLIKRWFISSSTSPTPSDIETQVYALVERLKVSGHRLERTGPAHEYRVPLSSFIMAYPDLEASHTQHGLPHPKTVAGPNPLRAKAAGNRCMAVPLFAYGDDTSGNVSKRWNKHNSFLFQLAGLPAEQLRRANHVHFYATSNIAPPLEMLHAFVQELKGGMSDGWWAWDCLYRERVLLIPCGLALEGDNPMQSEFSSHIGMMGRCFCRICTIYQTSNDDPADDEAVPRLTEEQRLHQFMTTHPLRSREATLAELREQLDAVVEHTAPSRVKKRQTNSGVKDRYFHHFFDQLETACAEAKSGKLGDTRIRELIQECRAQMPENLFNPTFDLPDFDPTRDTPVEILHVILLGFVKYFWRDAVSRMSAEDKKELQARLCSIDISGIGIDRVQARTLVQYAGSLVGRDFRTVVQVAPGVLPGLVSPEAYTAWITLSALAAFAFRPAIQDIGSYLPQLEDAIDNFLEATALWNHQWFNKPKFHVILHLPMHIRRFGPAPLYATETFESFNHVIRLRSIHSNRHAPSFDIAQSFSHVHAVRHLLSGGFIPTEETGSPMRQAGSGVLRLAQDPVLRNFMSLGPGGSSTPSISYRIMASAVPMAWESTPASEAGLPLPPGVTASDSDALYSLCSSVTLANNDFIEPGTLIFYTASSIQHIARVLHILTQVHNSRRIWAVIAPCDVGEMHPTYCMPRITIDRTRLLTIRARDIVAAVSSFHDCIAHGCKSSKTLTVVQERFATTQLTDEIVHSKFPDDRLLNLAQFRNAHLLDSYRPRRSFMDPSAHREDVIRRAIEVKASLDRAKAAEAEKKREDKEKRAAAAAAKRDAAASSTSAGPKKGTTKRKRSVKATKGDAGPSQADDSGQQEKRPRTDVTEPDTLDPL